MGSAEVAAISCSHDHAGYGESSNQFHNSSYKGAVPTLTWPIGLIGCLNGNGRKTNTNSELLNVDVDDDISKMNVVQAMELADLLRGILDGQGACDDAAYNSFSDYQPIRIPHEHDQANSGSLSNLSNGLENADIFSNFCDQLCDNYGNASKHPIMVSNTSTSLSDENLLAIPDPLDLDSQLDDPQRENHEYIKRSMLPLHSSYMNKSEACSDGSAPAAFFPLHNGIHPDVLTAHQTSSPSSSTSGDGALPATNQEHVSSIFTTNGGMRVCNEAQAQPCPGSITGIKMLEREAVYAAAAMQPVDWVGVLSMSSGSRPKPRRNVRISHDPQTVSARRRRERISDRIRVLQRLVPGGTKMDTASMLDEAIHYLKFLKSQVQALQWLERRSALSSSLSSSSTAAAVPYCYYSSTPSKSALLSS